MLHEYDDTRTLLPCACYGGMYGMGCDGRREKFIILNNADASNYVRL